MSNKTENNHAIYLQSYRKYKFWFNFFYLFLLFVVIFLPLDIKELNLIANYQEIKNFGKNINKFDLIVKQLHLNAKKQGKLKQIQLKEINEKLTEYFNEYNKSRRTNDSLIGIWKTGHRFDPQNKATKEYYKKRRKYLIDYIKNKFGKLDKSIFNYLKVDSILISKIQIDYDSLRNRQFILKPTISKKTVSDSIAELMFKKIHNIIDSLGNIYLYPTFEILPTELGYNQSDSLLTFNEYKTICINNEANLDSLEKEHSGEIPYVGAKLPFKKYLTVIYLIALLCLFTLPFYYINYKYREDNIIILERVNSFENILTLLSRKSLSKKISNQLKKWFPWITTFVIPFLSFLVITYLFSGIWKIAIYFSIIIIVMYLILYSCSKNKSVKPWLKKTK